MTDKDSVKSFKTIKTSRSGSLSPDQPFLPNEGGRLENDVALKNDKGPPNPYVKWGKGKYTARSRDVPTDIRPLHTSTQTGSYGTIKSLLATGADPNEQDDMGKAPLHIASKALDVKIMKLLIDSKADVNILDMLQMNPLHYVLLSGKRNRSKAVVECMELLLSKNVNVNAIEITGQTALHFAAIRSEEKWVDVLIRNGAYFCGRSNDESSSLYIVIKNCPNCIMTTLDTCIIGPDGRMNEDKLSMKQTSAKGFSEIMLNFEHLQHGSWNTPTIKCDPTVFFMNILDLKKNNDDPNFHLAVKDIFMHPSTQSYVYFRWFKAKWLYYSLVLLSHLVYSSLFSAYSVILYKNICKPIAYPTDDWQSNIVALSNETTCFIEDLKDGDESVVEDHWTDFLIAIICWLLLIPFTFIFVVKELTKVTQQLSSLKSYNVSTFFKTLLNYIVDAETLLSWLIIYSFFIISFHENPFNILTNTKTFTVARYQYHVSAYGVFMTWLLMMLMIGRATELGLYVGMLKKVTKTFIKFLGAYVCLIIAFMLSFYILLEGQHTYANNFLTMGIKVSLL